MIRHRRADGVMLEFDETTMHPMDRLGLAYVMLCCNEWDETLLGPEPKTQPGRSKWDCRKWRLRAYHVCSLIGAVFGDRGIDRCWGLYHYGWSEEEWANDYALKHPEQYAKGR